jgi:hypothetical protein
MSVPYIFGNQQGFVPASELDADFNYVSMFAFIPLATAPSSPVLGQVYFDTTLGYPRVWNGTSWNGFLLT